MKLPVSEKLYNLAQNCPFPLYVVGGFVRDFLAGLHTLKTDVDICAPADTEAFVEISKNCGATVTAVYKNTGTVKLAFGSEQYEFASFRSDEYVRGVHKPVKTFFTDDIVLDAKRRDFKINAIYYDIKDGKFLDPLGGMEDVKNKLVNTVADADKVFGEDGLRLMRLARQCAQTGFKPSEECLDGARNNAKLISDVTPERIYAELDAILHADERYGVKYAQYDGLKILDGTGVLDIIIPELTLGRGMLQNEQFHSHDVLEHSLRAVKYADSSVRLAALLHDAGKPYCKLKNGVYHGHDVVGAEIAENICARLKVPKKTAKEVSLLTALHMYDLRCDARENKIRKFIVRNEKILPKLLLIKQADFSGCRDDLSEAPCVTRWVAIVEKMKSEGAPLNLKQLAVRGDELINAGIARERVSEVLQSLLEDCAMDPSLNKKCVLLKRAATLYAPDAQ